jgi:hypothetical protein
MYFTVPFQNTVSFKPGTDTLELGLQVLEGDVGLHTFVQLIEPTDEKYPAATRSMWGGFKIGVEGVITVEDGSNIPTRQWVIFQDTADGSYSVGLWDGMLQCNPKTQLTK